MTSPQEKLLAHALFEIRAQLSRRIGNPQTDPDVRAAAELAYALHNFALASMKGEAFEPQEFLDAVEHVDKKCGENFAIRFRNSPAK
jgi:hypothetical protein